MTFKFSHHLFEGELGEGDCQRFGGKKRKKKKNIIIEVAKNVPGMFGKETNDGTLATFS